MHAYPAWFYMVFSQVKLVALIKQEAPAGLTPDVRPLGIAECLRRVFHRALVKERKDTFAQHFFPQQGAVGMANGTSMITLELHTLLEANPDWVLIKLDLREMHTTNKGATATSGVRILTGSCPCFLGIFSGIS
jgi:hypothetical protein